MLLWFNIFLLLLLASPSWAGLPPTRILDEGVDKGVAFKFDCVGAGIACTQSGVTGTLTVGGGGSGDSVSIDGVAVTDPNFNSTGDVDFVDTANVVTGVVVSVRPNSVALGTDTTGNYAGSSSEGGGATSLEADGVDALTEIAQSIKTAANDTSPLVIGTAGSNGEIAKWNTDGTLTDSNLIVGTLTDTKFCTYTAAGTVINCPSDGGSGAPTTADYLVGTADAGLSAEIVVGTTPGGELGGTWGTPTIDDSVTVTGWVMGDSTATTPAADDNDTSLATTAYVQTELSAGVVKSFNLPIYSAKLTGAFVVFTPPTADACTQGAQIDAGDGNWRLLFDATTDECATWQFIMPTNYASAPLLDVMFSMASGESNEVEFEAAIYCYTPTTDTADIGTASFSNVAVGTATTVSATAGEAYLQTITLTDDSCAAGDIVFVVLSTDANDATNDDATGDREVVGVNLRYTGL